MSIAHVHGSISGSASLHGSHAAGRPPLRSFAAGQTITLTVQRQLSRQFYLAQIANRSGQLVESSVALSPGLPMRATVVSAGARLELRLIDSDSQSTVLVSESDPNDEDSQGALWGSRDGSSSATLGHWVDAMSAKFDLRVTAASRTRLVAAMSAVADPGAMALAGLYLEKSGIPLVSSALDALYSAQRGGASSERWRDSPVNLDPLLVAGVGPTSAGLQGLVERMNAAVNQMPTAAAPKRSIGENLLPAVKSDAGANTGSDGPAQEHAARAQYDLVEELLKVPAGATVSRHFGTFPILVSGQLLELQFVAFQHREVAGEPPPVKRLLMTLTTPGLGRVQVSAQAQGGRISVSFVGESDRAADVLARHAPEVRELVNRLGWHVDSVVYRVGRAEPAAAHAMRLTLTHSTLDQLL